MNRDRIIVERLHDHWTAWFDGEPQIAFGGATPAEAVDRLVGFALLRGERTADDVTRRLPLSRVPQMRARAQKFEKGLVLGEATV